MTRVPLTGGAYQSQALIASAQRCINLFPETNPKDSQAPVPVTHFPTPGLTSLGTPSIINLGRGLFQASTGALFACIGTGIYYIDQSYKYNLLGTIPFQTTPVSFADNSAVLVIVDGTTTGYCVNLQGGVNTFSQIKDPNFLGGRFVTYSDGFFLFSDISAYAATNASYSGLQWYISLINVTFASLTSGVAGASFNALDIVTKNGRADYIARVEVVHREPWVMGSRFATEVWYNSGAADFPFSPLPGAYIENGCGAAYSVIQADLSLFFLVRNNAGARFIVKGTGYGVKRCSTHAIEKELSKYARVDDCYASTYLQRGHLFVCFHFPTADRTWVYEMQTEQWHEWADFDGNGVQHRSRVGFTTYAYGENLGLGWADGQIYRLDQANFTNNGSPIIRVRTFPHILEDGHIITFNSIQIDLQTGTSGGPAYTGAPTYQQGRVPVQGPQVGPAGEVLNAPKMSLRVSFNRGVSFGNAYMATFGGTGEFQDSILFNSLGQGRDMVAELSWSAPVDIALQGAFFEFDVADQ